MLIGGKKNCITDIGRTAASPSNTASKRCVAFDFKTNLKMQKPAINGIKHKIIGKTILRNIKNNLLY
jgi:hypothetical protein